MKLHFIAFTLIALGALSEGVTNPMEMSILDDVDGEPSIATCSSGYYLVKAGRHDPGFKIHENCAKAGYTRSMIWLAYMYQNGYAGEEDPERAAYWDAQAAHAGNEIGMLNLGIDFLRGYGVDRDVVAGKYWVDKAANAGTKSAIELRDANYDLSVVTPDSDEEKFSLR